MKSVFQFLQMDHQHMQHQLCHPRRQASFDNTAIQRKIQQIRSKKQELRVKAQQKRQQLKAKRQRFQDFPLQEVLEDSLQPLDQSITLIVKQKMKFIEDKVYIGTKNNVNNQYISKVIDSNQAKPALKYQLSLFMEDMVSNLQSDIVAGQFEIFNKKDVIPPKNQQNQGGSIQPSSTKLIQIKKVQLSNKIQELKQQLNKTELQQQKLSPLLFKDKQFTIRSASANGSMISNSLNIDDYSIKSQRTKQAQIFIKKLQKQQEKQRKQRKKRQQQLKKFQIKSLQQKKQFQEQLKNEKHQQLKKKFENDRKQKMADFEKASRSKAEYQKFLSEYRKRMPLFKQKELNFSKKKQKQDKDKVMSILTEIKQAKRSIDINQLKQHEKKYKVIRNEFQSQKIANLKHRQKQIYLRHKQDKLYFRGRYHSMIKEQIQKQPQDPAVKRDELLKKKKQFGEKIKKQYVPSLDQKKQKQLEQLIIKLSKNKPNVETKDSNELGNKYLFQLHKLIKQMKQKGKVKVELPEQIKPRYKNYLADLKKERGYSTISYDNKDPEKLEQYAFKLEQKAKHTQKLLFLTQQVDIAKQLKQIDQLDMQLLKSAQIKAKLLNKYDPLSDNQSQNQ